MRSVRRYYLFAFLVLTLFAKSASAGSTIIHVNTEAGGDICLAAEGDGCPGDAIWDNVNGAMFWALTYWGVNDTYGHMYFTNLVTGERIKEFTTTEISTDLDDINEVE